MMQRGNSYMGEQKVGRLLAKFSLPCIVSLVVSALYNIVDHIFIGFSSLGMYGHIATTVVFPLTLVAEAFAFMCGNGTAVHMAIRQGEYGSEPPEARKDSRLARAVAGAIILTVLFSVIIIAVTFPLKDPLLYLLGASDNTISCSADYFNIIVGFFPVFMLMNTLNAVVRADGAEKYAMAASVTGAAINIILDPVFIYALDWGMKGAAWATAAGQSVSLIMCALSLFRSRMFRLTLRSFIPDFRIIRRCLVLGMSSFLNEIAIVIMVVSLNILLSRYGSSSVYGKDIPVAVIGIETRIFTVIFNIFSGLALGGQPVLSYNHGAGKYDRVRSCYRLILLWTIIIGAVVTVILEACPEGIISIFGTAEEPGIDHALYVEYGVHTLRIFLALVICSGVARISVTVFQALGKPGKAMSVAIVRDIVAFIPLVILIPYISEMCSPGSGVINILYSGPASDLIGCVLAAILTVSIFRGLKREEAAYRRNLELAEKFSMQAEESGNACASADGSNENSNI
ncbi:MAG: MATE family efflux transporter [Clostridia bacterium]|nr:MATE family efflux transporter [Clostridia bacterium]